MSVKATVLISAVGADGFPGAQAWDDSNMFQAPRGAHGRHGRNSPFPAAGASGGRLDVAVRFDPNRPGLIQMMGEGPLAGSRWEASPEAELLLNVRGGNGGAGGLGEIGQDGGQGFDGEDATKHSRGGDGTPGGDGGNGGHGTNGANGGPGGIVHIRVHEDDLDTLVGVKWDVLGGRSGPPGVHGFGGDGGRGGEGGASYSWTERVSYEVQYYEPEHTGSRTEYRDETHKMAGGSGGRGGDAGQQPADPLFSGQDGPPGAAQITVIHADGRTGQYPSRYHLVVTGFSFQDENQDGINEPGEHLIISDVVVSNTGGSPSPGAGRLHILINSTEWLQPVMLPLLVPGGILPGQSVKVPGVLKALIRNETKPRNLGTLLNAQDTVSLRAFSPRLQRDVPEFTGQLILPVAYKYPLLMTTPRSLDCVSKGDTVTFSWTVQNISTKSHGLTTNKASTHLSDPGGMFDLKRAEADTPHEILDAIGVLQPGEKKPITVDFQVSELAEEFSTGSMLIKLLLADPGNPKMFRAAVSFDLRIQISPSYRYNPSARFLLVVNAQSPNAFVLQIINFIQNGLGLAVDVFNLSLTGSFMTSTDGSRGETENSVLTNYAGKSVIILGNTMNYFQAGTREPWELLDAAETFGLARQGTGFLVVSPTNTASLQAFVEVLSISGVSFPSTSPDGTNVKDLKDAIQVLATTTHPSTLTVPIKKTLLRNLDKTMAKRAHAAGHELGRAFPLRRFFVGRGADPVAVATTDAVAPVDDTNDDGDDIYNAEPAKSKPKKAKKPPKPKDPKQQKGGVLDIIEGLPHNAKLVATLPQPHSKSPTAGISDYNVAMLVHALPFEDQCEIFWNVVGMSATDGVEIGRDDVPAGIVYGGEKLGHLLNSGGGGSGRGEQVVHGKACEAVSWSIATQLASELTHFCAAGGGGDSSSSLLVQLPLLSKFISSTTSRPSISSSPPSANNTTTMLIHLLAHLNSVTTPLSFGQRFGQNMTGAGKRRKKVRNMLINDISQPLLAKIKSPPPVVEESSDAKDADKKKVKKSASAGLAQALTDTETKTKKQLIELRKNSPHLDRVSRAHELACMVLAQLTGTPAARFIDLVNGNGTGTSVKGGRTTTKVMDRDDYVKLRQRQTQRTSNLAEDVAFSSDRLRNMVTKTEPVTGVSSVVVQPEEEEEPQWFLDAPKPVVVVQEERVLGPELVEI